MDISTAIKYLEFLSNECDRYLSYRALKDDDMTSVIVEFDRIMDTFALSNLPADLRAKLSELHFNYSIKDVQRGNFFLVGAVLTFGIYGYVVYMRNQEVRKQALQELKFDTSRLASFIRMNHAT